MINPSDERISALVDGELDEREHQASVDKLLARSENRKAWGRYHLIGDTLKRSLPKGMDHDFSSRVMAALDNEPTVLAPPAPTKSSWGQRVAGLAVAASVTAVAILGVQFMYQQDGQTLTPQMAQTSSGLSPIAQSQQVARANLQPSRVQQSLHANIQTVTQSSVTMAHPPKPVKQFHPRLNKYLVDHNQQAPRAAVQGMIPYARIVAYPNSHRLLIQAQK
ncbi:MAG: sigma-E factor negative regulatory protein [Gammaproteobacteria bacterium]|nr:sigma-E factor negative regulatory protein [Gammaproteobacteria bacterium]